MLQELLTAGSLSRVLDEAATDEVAEGARPCDNFPSDFVSVAER